MTEAEAALGRLIRALEIDDAPLNHPEDADAFFQLLRRYHAAMVDLLRSGPLDCSEAVAREQQETELPTLQPGAVTEIRAELLQLMRSTVRFGTIEYAGSGISTYGTTTFRATLTGGRAKLSAAGATRNLLVLQCLLLMHDVGLANVHECLAPECGRLFVKVYRRKFCSERCQKRVNRVIQANNRIEKRERLNRRRKQQRRKGA